MNRLIGLHNISSLNNSFIKVLHYCTIKKSDQNINPKSFLFDVNDMSLRISVDIKSYFKSTSEQLSNIVNYSFSTVGKMIRPQIILLFAATVNDNLAETSTDDSYEGFLNVINEKQYKIALIAEMIHSASLMHDDLIDCSNTRRGVQSCHARFGPEKAVLGGDFILTTASQILAGIGSPDVVVIISRLIEDLIRGEIMQLTRFDSVDEKFSHYYTKTYRKSASLIANCCKAVALLSNELDPSEAVLETSFEFGRNLGMTFQLVDDILDVVSTQAELGKPGKGNDMRLGLATGPVLFASEKFPEVNDLILRKLSHEGDYEKVMEYIVKADAVQETRKQAQQHHDTAVRLLLKFPDSPYRQALLTLTETIFHRTK